MKLVYVLSVVIGLSLLQAIPVRADTGNDFQQWSLIFVNHHLDNNWSASMQLENRLRYLLHVTHPLGDSGKYYLAAQEAVRFNAASNDSGPVDGFEQSRLYFGVGRKMSKKLKVEVGYLWNYQRFREGQNHSNHVLRLQFLIDTKGLHPFFAGT